MLRCQNQTGFVADIDVQTLITDCLTKLQLLIRQCVLYKTESVSWILNVGMRGLGIGEPLSWTNRNENNYNCGHLTKALCQHIVRTCCVRSANMYARFYHNFFFLTYDGRKKRPVNRVQRLFEPNRPIKTYNSPSVHCSVFLNSRMTKD